MIKLTVQRNTLTGTKADLLVLFISADKEQFRKQVKHITSQVDGITPQLNIPAFVGKENETLLLHSNGISAKRLLLVGLGAPEKLTVEVLRRCAARATKYASSLHVKSLALMEPDEETIKALRSTHGAEVVQNIGLALAEGAILSVYKFDKYISDKKPFSLRRIILISTDTARVRALNNGAQLAEVLCEATCAARDLENAPGNEIFPESLAAYAIRSGRKYGFKTTVFNEKKIKQLGMGGLLAVAQGSDKPPRFIIMEHGGRKRGRPTVVLVGKGVTFDSGGISIKPAANMAEMKMDMSGAAAVIGTMHAVARLKLPVHVIGLVPTTENLLSGAAMKPGDIVRHYNGKTSEVDNTDAEGRLILADALAYAARYKPDVVIDLATLTGACVVALGHVATGMMGNDQDTMDRLRESGERTYERVWQLPMFDEYERLIKSDVADVKNVGGRWGGAITASMFLRTFIGKYKWVHLDIAGTAIMEESTDYVPKGGSGVGVRLVTDFLRHWRTNG